MQQVRRVCVVCAAIISAVLMLLAAPAWAGENRFVFVPQADSPGNDYLRLDQSSLEESNASVTNKAHVMRLRITSVMVFAS
jgi:hypothetical protein